MRRYAVMTLLVLAIVPGSSRAARAQWGSCPGGACPAPDTSVVRARASVRSRSGPGSGGLLRGLGGVLFGRRQGLGGSAYGSAYASAYGSAGTFGGGGSCYSSMVNAADAPYFQSPCSAPPMNWSPPPLMRDGGPPVFGEEDGWPPVSYLAPLRVTVPAPKGPVRPRVRRLARAVTERRPTAVAVRPTGTGGMAMATATRERERRPMAVAERPRPARIDLAERRAEAVP